MTDTQLSLVHYLLLVHAFTFFNQEMSPLIYLLTLVYFFGFLLQRMKSDKPYLRLN